MNENFKIALAQFSRILAILMQILKRWLNRQIQQNNNRLTLIIFPELSTLGYPAEDLIFVRTYKTNPKGVCPVKRSQRYCDGVRFCTQTEDRNRYNSAAVMKDGQFLGVYNKHNLPNYGVFDEKRYFQEGHQHLVFEYLGHKFGVLICEDVWSLNTVKQLSQLNVETVLILNASPKVGKPQHRVQTLNELAKQLSLNIVYVNQVGGQDDLIFDGSSFVSNHNGQLALQAPSFQESVYFAEYDAKQKLFKTAKPHLHLTLLLKFIRHWSWQHVTMCNVRASWGDSGLIGWY